MKRGLRLFLVGVFILLLASTFVSAFSFSEFWNKITGNVVTPSCDNSQGEDYCVDNSQIPYSFISISSKPSIYTLSFFIKPNSYSTTAVASSSSTGANANVWGMVFRDTGAVEIWTSDGTKGQQGIVANDWNSAGFPSNEWTHVVAVVGWGNITYYKNGVWVNAIPQTVQNSGNSYKFSMNHLGEYNGFYLDGKIRNVELFGKVMSGSEVSALYNSRKTNSGDSLIQFTCDNNELDFERSICSNGCENSECIVDDEPIKEPEDPIVPTPVNNVTCSDSDNGKNYYIKGTVTHTQIGGNYTPFVDSCRGINNLTEYSCDYNKSVQQDLYYCADGCEDGKCIQQENEEEQDYIIKCELENSNEPLKCNLFASANSCYGNGSCEFTVKGKLGDSINISYSIPSLNCDGVKFNVNLVGENDVLNNIVFLNLNCDEPEVPPIISECDCDYFSSSPLKNAEIEEKLDDLFSSSPLKNAEIEEKLYHVCMSEGEKLYYLDKQSTNRGNEFESYGEFYNYKRNLESKKVYFENQIIYQEKENIISLNDTNSPLEQEELIEEETLSSSTTHFEINGSKINLDGIEFDLNIGKIELSESVLLLIENQEIYASFALLDSNYDKINHENSSALILTYDGTKYDQIYLTESNEFDVLSIKVLDSDSVILTVPKELLVNPNSDKEITLNRVPRVEIPNFEEDIPFYVSIIDYVIDQEVSQNFLNLLSYTIYEEKLEGTFNIVQCIEGEILEKSMDLDGYFSPNEPSLNNPCERNECFLNEKCYSFGNRKNGEYCSDSNFEFVPQKEEAEFCDENFECKSNLCIDGSCLSSNFLKRFIEWLKNLFS